jgi:hypothetical protein
MKFKSYLMNLWSVMTCVVSNTLANHNSWPLKSSMKALAKIYWRKQETQFCQKVTWIDALENKMEFALATLLPNLEEGNFPISIRKKELPVINVLSALEKENIGNFHIASHLKIMDHRWKNSRRWLANVILTQLIATLKLSVNTLFPTIMNSDFPDHLFPHGSIANGDYLFHKDLTSLLISRMTLIIIIIWKIWLWCLFHMMTRKKKGGMIYLTSTTLRRLTTLMPKKFESSWLIHRRLTTPQELST